MVQLLSGGRRVLRHSLAMDTHLEGPHLRTTTIPTSSHHQEVAWAGIRGHLILPIRVVVLTTTSRVLNRMIASHQATLLDQVTTIMGSRRLLTMDNLSIRHLNRTMVLDMVSLDTVLQHQTSSTMDSHQRLHSKATPNSQILILGLHTVDLGNGRREVHQLQMELTRHLLHLTGHHLSNLPLMVKHMAQQLDLMGMLSRVIHSRVGNHQLHMHRMHQQHQVILSKVHNKVAMHSTQQPNLPMVIKQLKPMRAMVTRELQLILTMEVATRSQVIVLLRQLVRLVMLLHQQLSLLMASRQHTPSHLQTRPVMINLQQQHRLRAATPQPLQIHSRPLPRGCLHSLLLDLLVGSGRRDV